ncbi:hypothetical protein F5Y10DRAFT_282328 [Nemania abortiva]|nr:hypothetical protein F5Y10DRAFT_282328 [Nemania abortiva]
MAVGATRAHALASDKSPLVYIPAWLFVFFCPLIVGMRIWARMSKGAGGAGLWADDYIILLSLVFAITTDIILLYACHHGYGKHFADLTEHQMYESSKSVYLMQIVYKVSMNLTKVSILLQYVRLFWTTAWFKRTCYAIIAFVALFCTTVTLATIFQCQPVAAAFYRMINTENKCIDNRSFWYTNAGVSIGTDVIILAIPWPLIYNLHCSRARKFQVACLFMAGGFVVLASCLRVPTLELQLTSPEPLYDIDSTMWTIIEMSLAIVCACLPSIGHHVFGRSLALKSFLCNPKTIIGTRKSRGSSQQANIRERQWSGVECQEGIKLARTPRGDTSLDLPSIHDDGSDGLVIRQTLEYDIEYSAKTDESGAPGPLSIV